MWPSWTTGPAGSPAGQAALRFYPLVTDPLVLVVPRGHWAGDLRVPVQLQKLRDEPWLAPPAGEASRRAVDQVLAATGGVAEAPSEFEGLATILSLVARGIGVAILPRLTLAGGDARVTVRDLPGTEPGQGPVRGRQGLVGAPPGGGGDRPGADDCRARPARRRQERSDTGTTG